MNVASRLLFPLALLAASSGLLAQDAIEPYVEYRKRVEAAQNISPLDVGLFGEQVSLYNGSTTFSVTDIDVPGNNALPVRLSRRLAVELQPQNSIASYDALLRGAGNWDVDVPYMAATYAVSAGDALRCNGQYVPSGAPQGFLRGDIWQGISVNIPGKGSTNALGMLAGLPRPSGGATYKLTTPERDMFDCISMKPGFTGQGFRMTTASGLRYYFDIATSRTAATLEGQVKRIGDGPLVLYVQRNRLYLLASKIEDRFGNTVEFQYNANGHPTRIWSNDEREITLAYTNGRLATATSHSRSWEYKYTHASSGLYARLSQVIQPDDSSWQYAYTDDLMPHPDPAGLPPLPWCGGYPLRLDASLTLTATHPAGAVGTFQFSNRRHYRSGVHATECQRTGDLFDPDYRLMVPHFFDVMSIDSKTLGGPGLSPQAWTYSYATLVQNLWGVPTAPPSYPCTTCVASKTVTMTRPDGTGERHTFGMRYHDNDGRQLKVEILRADTTVVRSEDSIYMTEAQAATQPFYGLQGSILGGIGDPASTRLRPVTNRTIRQQGVDFVWLANTFDTMARPKSVTRTSTVAGNPMRTEETTYYDDLAKWVLGQVHKVVCTAPAAVPPAGCGSGMEMFKRSYDPTYALPLVTERFGKIEQTLTWNTASTLASGQRGTASSVADGNGHVTTLAGWLRGIPQTIQYPGTPEAPSGATRTAHVNSRGWIEWVDDERGSRTCYAHDAMGRISQITYPSETAAHTCNTSTWAVTTQAFQQADSAEYGIPSGHWRQTVATGNGRRVVYFDALWRPLLTREYDTANASGTQRFQRFAYNHDGKRIFASYPAATHNPVTGTWTEYDALGRATSLSQDSELGLLTTVTTYENGFHTRVSSPKFDETITRYLAWDQPTSDFPTHIAHPVGAFTHITRDVFGKPTILRRSNHTSPTDGTLAVDRAYTYNGHQELCRSVEPETGATLMGYDNAGNLAWSAAGLPAATACHGTGTVPVISARRVDRSYDARNRLKTLVFPGDGNGNQAWDYYADGKPQQIRTWNIGVPGADPMETRNLYTWLRRGLLKTELIAVPAWYTFSVEHGYNANGFQTLLTYPSGHTVTNTLNALGQPTSITGGTTTYASGIGYHANGAVAGFTYGNSIVHTMQQNSRQLPDTVSSVFGATDFLHDGYNYDRHGNVAGIADLRFGKGGARSRTMTYDGLDRLTSVASPMYGTSGANYAYNVLDDILRVNTGGAQARNQHYCYDAKRQLTAIKAGSCSGATLVSLGYDVQGNLASRDGQEYRFDYGNRLREVDGAERYRYDGHGRRVLAMQFSTGTVLSQYGLDGKLLFQKSERTTLQTDHVYLGGSLIAIHERPSRGSGTAVVKYQHTDGLGSPVAVTLQDRPPVEESEYEPYGLVLNRPSRDGPGYTGHVEDAATGLVYMQQRYYDPQIGVFLSIDPITAYQNPLDQFHRYRYANSNPYKFTDPDGRQASPLAVIHYYHKHYFRNAHNKTYGTPQEASDRDWEQMSSAESMYHQHGVDGKENRKWIDPTGHHEAVYDGQDNLVTDRLNGGTFNFVPPNSWVGHFLEDILPYYLWGNGPIIVKYPSPTGNPPIPNVIVGPIEKLPPAPPPPSPPLLPPEPAH